MLLPPLQKGTKLPSKGFYFGCDNTYFELYGKALALSISKYAPWANVHVHLFNPDSNQLEWCNRQNNITYSWEDIENISDEIKATYFACVRFIRIPQIFQHDVALISFDCDMLMNNTVNEDFFDNQTQSSKVTCKPKNGDSLASSIIFGIDNFREEYSNLLLEEFKKNNIYWFLDQHILDMLVSKNKVDTMGFEWTGLKMNKDELMWTAKGNKKNSKEQYINAVNMYNNIAKEL